MKRVSHFSIYLSIYSISEAHSFHVTGISNARLNTLVPLPFMLTDLSLNVSGYSLTFKLMGGLTLDLETPTAWSVTEMIHLYEPCHPKPCL